MLEIGVTSNIYLLIFTPLLFALLCQIITFKNSGFYSALASFLLLFILLFKLFPNVLIYEKITNDYGFSILSAGLEFSLDIVAMLFLILIIFLEFLVLIFYYQDIKNALDKKNIAIFYTVFLLKIFSLIGIITSNNLFNLYFYIEIYGFAFYSISSTSHNKKLLNLSFKSFCLSSASSIMILISFFIIYVTFGELNFAKIFDNIFLLPPDKAWFLSIISLLLACALLIKFFPLWQYFEKIKSTSPLSNFLIIDVFFIKVLVGIFLVIKFIYLFCGNNSSFSQLGLLPIMIIGGFLLAIFGSFKLVMNQHLKLSAIFFTLINLGFVISAIAIKSIVAMRALFFLLLNFSLIGFFIFLCAIYLKKNSYNSFIEKIKKIINANNFLALPMKLIMMIIWAIPFVFSLCAFRYLLLSDLDLNIKIIMIVAIFCAVYAQIIVLSKRIFDTIIANYRAIENKDVKRLEAGLKVRLGAGNNLQNLSLWLLIIVIYICGFMLSSMNNLSLKFASFLLANAT